MIEFQYSASNSTLICKFGEKLDANVANELSKLMKEKIDDVLQNVSKEKLLIVFDLKKTDYASSLFLRVVMMSAARIEKGNLTVINANQFIKDLFKTSGLGKFIKMESDTVEEIPTYEPPKSFSQNAWIKSMDEYKKMYKRSIEEPEAFWREQAAENIIWDKPFDKVMEWKEPYAKWFTGGKLNVSANCLDKHLYTIPDKIAILWEGEPDEPNDAPAAVRKITYKELHELVCKFANVLKKNNIAKGDRIIIYMPMVPEAVVAMLACARIGAIHSVIFAGFSPQAIAERVHDSKAKLIITNDGVFRRGSVLSLKKTVDESFAINNPDGSFQNATIEKVIVYKHTSNQVKMEAGRDLWWHEEMDKVDADCPPVPVDSEDQLFLLYTSGSTGKPKGIMHSTAGYLLGAKLTHKYIFDIKDNDIYWCTADVGWITGHTYIVYGPLANGATAFMYEGAPNYPDPSRFWKLIEKHKITILYTAPTAIRSFMKWGDKWPQKHNLSSLRLLGSVGEPINPQAWLWYNEQIGHGKCPIVDTWWQTETGAIMVSPLPGAVATKPGSATFPFFGIVPAVINSKREEVKPGESGTFVIKKPWPSMLRGLWGDPERYVSAYWSDNPGVYTTGDSARIDKDGYIWVIGREDDVLNVSGHRIGTAEVESVLVNHPAVAEAAAVGRADDLKGSVLVLFVTLMQGIKHSDALVEELKQHVSKQMGAVVRPEEIRFAEALPKTRSGKIMRRLLKQVAAGTEITGDVTTLEDFNVLAQLSE